MIESSQRGRRDRVIKRGGERVLKWVRERESSQRGRRERVLKGEEKR